MKRVGQVALEELRGGNMVRLPYPPYDVLVALVGREVMAIEDGCNHAGASLSEGPREGDCVSCPMHGYIFDLKSGKLVEPAGLCDDQRTFVATVDGDYAVIWDPFEITVI